MTYIQSELGNIRPITAAAHHRRSDVICDCVMTISFTDFLQCLAIRRLSECFVKDSAGITEAKIQNTEMSSKRQRYAVTAWKVYQNASLGIFDRLECLRNMFGAGVGDAGTNR